MMAKRLSLLMTLMAMICFSVEPAGAQEPPRVAAVPFEVHAQQDLSYLGTEIPRVIEKQLAEDGAKIVAANTAGILIPGRPAGVQQYRRIGIQSGADYVVWGSLTWIGTRFSLDAKMIEAIGEKPLESFFVEGDGIENLFGTVRQLGRDIAMRIFQWKRIVAIRVEGNNRIEEDAVKRRMKTAPGDLYRPGNLSKDLKAIYAMGYFDDVRILAEDAPGGKIIVIRVKEKPTIRYIHFSGNRVFEDDKLKENLTIKTGSILNVFIIQNNIQRIETLYKEKNYQNVKVGYDVEQRAHNQADLTFVIEEGVKLRVERITFVGNHAYTDKKLKGLMTTSEKGFFFWLTSSGELNRENLNQDASKLAAFYHNNGYIDARIGEPQVEFKKDFIAITIKVEEGSQYKVGRVGLEGDLIMPKDQLLQKLKITKEEFYDRETIRKDVLYLSDLYSDVGYAYADVAPSINKNPEKLTVDIDYKITKGRQVYFEKIVIDGNTKTRDKVIRRELQVQEQGLFNGSGIKAGVRNLYRLDYFEDVKISTTKGSSDDSILMKIDVTEKPTGAFTFGGGYSTANDFFVTGSVSQRNLFGRGQTLQFKGELGGRSDQYTMSFMEPWLFDIPLSAGFEIYKVAYDYDLYDKDGFGGGVRFGYPVFAFTRAELRYDLERAEVTNIDPYAADSIKELEGTNITSKIGTSLTYDSRDRVFNATSGSEHSLGVEYAGLGGNIGYTKVMAETGWYFPLFWDVVNFIHGRAGYLAESSGKLLPDYATFYLGGMNSVRGFDWREIHATDDQGKEIGGNKFVQFNFELQIPLFKKQGLIGVLFYDAGEVFGDDADHSSGMRQSVGYGIRWYSPVGPIRLENGYILNPREGEPSNGKWEFTMGTAF